ncbi:Uncharacterised protein [uncultured archaeon]|nr:Uncharacterised protein [uncultured archaeon]
MNAMLDRINISNKSKIRPGRREKRLKARKVLLVALIGFVALCGIGMATSGTTQVQASIGPFITLAVPGSITGWTLSPGDNTYPVGGLAVTSNSPWHIFVQSSKNTPNSGNDYYGHFWSPTVYSAGHGAFVGGKGPGFMTNPLILNAGYGDVSLSDDPAPLASGNSLSTTQVSFDMKQAVTWEDYPASDYRVVMVFTASN